MVRPAGLLFGYPPHKFTAADPETDLFRFYAHPQLES